MKKVKMDDNTKLKNYTGKEIVVFPGFNAGITTVNYGGLFYAKKQTDDQRNMEKLLLLLDRKIYKKMVPVHYKNILDISNTPPVTQYFAYDGLFFDYQQSPNKELILACNTADCPIIILQHAKKVYGLLHSGWQSTKYNIVKDMLQLMTKKGYSASELDCYIWPGICLNHYEVGLEFINNHFPEKVKGRNLDLSSIIVKQLLDNGIKEEKISQANFCSFHSKDDNDSFMFHSFRRNYNEPSDSLKKISRDTVFIVI